MYRGTSLSENLPGIPAVSVLALCQGDHNASLSKASPSVRDECDNCEENLPSQSNPLDGVVKCHWQAMRQLTSKTFYES